MIEEVHNSRHLVSRGIRYYLPLFILLMAGQIVLYGRAFSIKPAGDDFGAPLSEIHRGEQAGPLSFFQRSAQRINYRPFQSLFMWAFGRLSDNPEQRYRWIRVMHFLGMGSYAAVALMWLAQLPIRRAATTIAAVVFVLHPVFPIAVASIDGFGSLYSSAFLWLGAWLVFVYRDRPAPAAVAAVICFFIGGGFKEFIFGLLPLAALTAFWFGSRRCRWRVSLWTTAALVISLIALMVIRRYTIPPGDKQGFGYVDLRPAQLVKNAVFFATGLLFFGNSIWVYVHRSPSVLVLAGMSVVAAITLLVVGVNLLWRQPPARFATAKAADAEIQSGQVFSVKTWVIFVLLTLPAASFPANAMFHVSEMYVPPLVLPLAMLCGLAAEGYARGNGILRLIAAATAFVALGSAVFAILWKIEGLRDVGERAEAQLQQIAGLLPHDGRTMRMALVYRRSQLPANRTFSVYRMGDDALLNSVPEEVVKWMGCPTGLSYDTLVVDDISEVTSLRRYDVVLTWEATDRTFRRVP